MAPTVYTSNKGINLRINAVPSLFVVDAQKTLKEPKPPSFKNEDKGGRIEINPNDPDYLEALAEYQNKKELLVTNILLQRGLSIIEPLPNDILPVDSEEWEEDVTQFGITISERGAQRRVEWLKYYALTDGDVSELLSLIAQAGGLVTEEQVAKAAEGFRDN